MKTIFIIGMDIAGYQKWWDEPDVMGEVFREKPWLDGGRLKFDREDRVSMDNQVYEMCALAGIQGIAVGLRGVQDAAFKHFPIFRSALEDYQGPFAGERRPTLMPFVDTGALGDVINHDKYVHTPFDFLNDQHLERVWTHILQPFYQTFPEKKIHYERSANKRLVILFWSIASHLGDKIINQEHAQRLLDYLTVEMNKVGLGSPDFIVDQSWTDYTLKLNVYGVHAWFKPHIQQAHTFVTHHAVTVGVAVPGFHVATEPTWIIRRNNGLVLRKALQAMRTRSVDYVFLESYNNLVESAGFYRCDLWGTLYLDIVREHLDLTSPLPSHYFQENKAMIALSEIKDFALYDDLLPGSEPDTHALPWPSPGALTVYSLQDDGSDGTRPKTTIGPWESGKIIDNKLVFRTGNHVKMFWIVQGI